MNVLIDNYDSFSYNLYQLLGQFSPDVRVIRNDEMTTEEIGGLRPEHIIISPGPGRPAEAGICEKAVRYFAGKVPILGVCLGHQAVCEAYGGTIAYAKQLMHGKQSETIVQTASPLFAGLPEQITAGRYHSLVAEEASLPPELEVLARSDDGEVMAVGHIQCAVYGVQFHPESILTPQGPAIIKNFLNM